MAGWNDGLEGDAVESSRGSSPANNDREVMTAGTWLGLLPIWPYLIPGGKSFQSTGLACRVAVESSRNNGERGCAEHAKIDRGCRRDL